MIMKIEYKRELDYSNKVDFEISVQKYISPLHQQQIAKALQVIKTISDYYIDHVKEDRKQEETNETEVKK